MPANLLDSLLAAPALVKILGAFAMVLVSARLKLHLGPAMALGALVLGAWCGLSPEKILATFLGALVDLQTWGLVVLVVLILFFGRILSLSGRLDRVVRATVARVGSRRRASALLPALIGLLPMPGGAILSAPMVESAAASEGLTPERLTAVNYWFRHLWEYWWPLYPGVIVAVGILEAARPEGINLGWFMLFEIPLTLVVFFWGKIFLLGRAYSKERNQGNERKENAPPEPKEKTSLGSLLGGMAPILLVVGLTLLWNLYVIAGKALGLPVPPLPKTLPLTIFVLLGIGHVFLGEGLGREAFWKMVRHRTALDMVFLILGVMIFRAMVSDSGSVVSLGSELSRAGVPVLVLVAALPFTAGLVTGIAVGFAGASFPVVAALMPHGASPLVLASYYVLAFGAGYTGMMLSPVHFCLVLTKDYFKASLAGTYRLLALPALFLFLTVLALSRLYALLGG